MNGGRTNDGNVLLNSCDLSYIAVGTREELLEIQPRG
jgi:hypothetical protein